MAKKKNKIYRKKELKLALKRSGALKANQVAASQVVAQPAPAPKAPAQSQATLSLEEFSAISAVADIRANLVETLYNEGIQSVADFAKFTEKEVLAFKGIGPATVAKLKENGVTFKA
ncbi:helix-hairpin-helix domain-containing protein [Streptococcus loxodontisalivarius]|uniref:Flap endonuclease-1-like 5' DNA nuclease n=1 Tax=Streptococcus loxodontisalivarius TaxID=1349415 RepID=A0ABS2PQ18_9STRE|nr:helix-hairpin-helix domain-containing protein [Streptococcus loxodontisalivarius]MBM7642136.1 putative flap endonuclease-1-like 5' DNA nuclease [Streptococcus loxodontisalivarius]